MASSKAVRLRKRKHILKRHQTEKLHCYTDNHQDTKRDVTLVTRKKKMKLQIKISQDPKGIGRSEKFLCDCFYELFNGPEA